MALRTIANDGPWRLVGTLDTVPEWVGWVHRDAERWRDVVLELAAEGRRRGLDDPAAGIERWPLRYQLTRDLVRALGQLARALDLPITCFWPWARRMWRNDTGPVPWPGWQLENEGQWRVRVMDAAASAEVHVREAANVKLELAHRVGLTYEGELTTPVPDGWGASQTSRGEDWNGRVCPGGATNSWWACIPLSVWWPGALAADRDVYVSATVPLGWHWEMALGAADDIAELDVERLVAKCRFYVAGKNLKAVAYMRNLPELQGRQTVTVETPADLVLVGASDSLQNLRPVQVAGTDIARVFRSVGETVITAPPVGTVVGAVLIALAEVLRAFGTAMGSWVDVWGRREPALEIPRLTGSLNTTMPQPPTHSVLAPPPPLDVEVLEVTQSSTARLPGESLSAWRRRARDILARQRDPSLQGVTSTEELARVQAEARAARGGSSTRAGGALLALALAAALVMSKGERKR